MLTHTYETLFKYTMCPPPPQSINPNLVLTGTIQQHMLRTPSPVTCVGKSVIVNITCKITKGGALWAAMPPPPSKCENSFYNGSGFIRHKKKGYRKK
jgi:hypothetical protein